ASLAHWRRLADARGAGEEDESLAPSSAAARVEAALAAKGALFFVEIVQHTGLLRVQVEEALGELVARGRVTADSFNGLRALVTPQRRRERFRGRGRPAAGIGAFDAAGRWALIGGAGSGPVGLGPTAALEAADGETPAADAPLAAIGPLAPGHADAAAIEHAARDRKSTRLNSSHVKISYAV